MRDVEIYASKNSVEGNMIQQWKPEVNLCITTVVEESYRFTTKYSF